MKALVRQTKRLTIIAFDGKIYTTNNDYSNTEFKEREPNAGEIISGKEIEGNNPEDIYSEFTAPLKAERKLKLAEKEALKVKMEAILNNAKDHTPSEIWAAVKWAASQSWGWRATDILLANNSLSKILLEKIGNYTVSAYDDNSIMIKAGNKRYGTLRKWLSVEDLLS